MPPDPAALAAEPGLLPWPRVRRILTLAAPIIGGMVSQNILNLVDTWMVGSLGKVALAAVALGGIANFVSVALVTGLSAGVQAVAARRLGEARDDQAALGLHAGLLVALVFGVPLSAALFATAPTWFAWLVDDAAVVAEGVPYIRARLVVAACVGANFAFRGFWNGVDKPQLYFRTLVTMHVCNAIISYVLVFGLFGLPALGALGAGIGTAAGTAIGTLTYVSLAFKHGAAFGWVTAGLRGEVVRNLLRISLPASLQQVLFALGMLALNVIVGMIGTAELAAAGVLVNLTLVAILPCIGLGIAAATLVGQALGRGDPADARRWGWQVVAVACAILSLLALVMGLGAEPILRFFLPTEPEAVAVALDPLRIVAVTILLDAVGMVLLNALLGAGAARTVARVSILLQWGLFLPAAYALGPVLGYGLTGVWLAQAVYRGLQAVLLAAIWQGRGWERIAV